jgi:hypothetical protein
MNGRKSSEHLGINKARWSDLDRGLWLPYLDICSRLGSQSQKCHLKRITRLFRPFYFFFAEFSLVAAQNAPLHQGPSVQGSSTPAPCAVTMAEYTPQVSKLLFQFFVRSTSCHLHSNLLPAYFNTK